MQTYIEQYRTAMSLNEIMVKSAVDYWTAMTFPGLYFAKFL
jgi:hypothetical protein